MQKLRFNMILAVLVGILVLSTILVGACSQNNNKPLDYKEVYIALYSHLIDIAKTPEAKEYVGLLFPAPPHLITTTERHNDLKAWKIAVERWPEGTREAFVNAYWFSGDFDKHFSGFFDHATTWPAWFIYDDGKIIPLGRALLIEADIDKLNLGRMLDSKDVSSKLEDTKWFLKSFGEQGNLKTIIEGSEITATFNSFEGQVNGSAGCNIYGGRYQVTDSRLSISEIYFTEMACLSPEGVMEQEQEFLSILSNAQSFEADDTTLTIFCSGGVQLYFTTATR